MGRIFKKITAVVVLLFLTASCFIVPVKAASDVDSQSEGVGINYLQSIIDLIKEMYSGEIDEQQIINGALKGMLETVDPYTTFFNDEEFNSFLETTEGNYSGVGITMSKEDDYIAVVGVTSGSPADKAGIKIGDRIVQIDGEDVTGMDINTAAKLIKGEEGTKVTLGIVKKGTDKVTQIELTREVIKIIPVTYEIKDNIGYIKIEQFNNNAYDGVREALAEMDKNNITKIILDLRDNPGGDVDSTVKIASLFVPQGVITKLDFKSSFYSDVTYLSTLQNPKYKLAVLVNENTASASEILAGAIQDSKVGVIIGTKTYGKGKVQTFIPLLTPEAYEKYSKQIGENITNAYALIYQYNIVPNDDEIIGWSKITTGYYYTPNGRMIDGVGLEPDIKIENSGIINGVDVTSIQQLRKISKPTLNSESPDVLYAEMILKANGYDVDTPDYILDEKTFKAIAKFQKDNGLYSYGVLDFSTQDALNNTIENLIKSSDKFYLSAVEYLNKQ